MKRQLPRPAIALFLMIVLVQAAAADGIATFADPMPNGGGVNMFTYINGSFGLYGGWSGPPALTIETPGGTFTNCTMHGYPMYIHPTGVVNGGLFTFFDANQVEVFRVTFYNGFADNSGLRCGPQTGGTVQFTYSAGGVQLPPGLSEPLQSPWINFEFHNRVQGPRGPEWTASFSCGAVGQADVNCDGAVTFADIDAFVQALSDPTAYATDHRWCDRANADVNSDGAVNFADIDPFVAQVGV